METEVLGGKPSSFEEGIMNLNKTEWAQQLYKKLCYIKKTNLLSQVDTGDP